MQKQLGELFTELKAITGRGAANAKVELLKKHDTPVLRYFLKLGFAKDLTWLLPEGAPPFKRMNAPAGMGYSNLFSEARKMKHFFDPANGGSPNLTMAKREMLFIQLLENLHDTDASLLIAVKDRKLGNVYSVTEKIALQAFPDLFTRQ